MDAKSFESLREKRGNHQANIIPKSSKYIQKKITTTTDPITAALEKKERLGKQNKISQLWSFNDIIIH